MTSEWKRRFLYSLDTPSAVPANRHDSYLKGWFVSLNGEDFEIVLVAGERRIPVFTRLPRPDVAKSREHAPGFKDSGFIVRFRRPGQQTPLRLIAVMDSEELVLADGIPCPDFSEDMGGVADTAADSDYQRWLAHSEPALFWPEHEIRSKLAALRYQPLISIVTAVPESHPYLIGRCIQSLLEQHYPNWQLCAASDSNIGEAAARDSRIRMLGTIREAMNAAQGEFVLRLDYRDELHPFALLEIVKALNSGTEPVDVLYVGEDETDFYGKRLREVCKPEYGFEAFLSWNFLGNGVMIRRELLAASGVYETGTDDSGQLLRILERTPASRVRHVAIPLYHVRTGNEQTAPLPRKKGRRSPDAVSDYLSRSGRSASIRAGLFPESFRICPALDTNVRIAVFIRTEDGSLQHAALAADVDRERMQVYELLGSGADPLFAGPPPPNPRTLRQLDDFTEDIFVFVNRPLETVNHFFFEELAAQAMRGDCGIVTGISLDLKGRILHSGLRRTGAGECVDDYTGLSFRHSSRWQQFSVVRSADALSDEFFAVKRSQLAAVGGFSAVHSADMPGLVRKIVELTHSRASKVIVTPYAVATFEALVSTATVDSRGNTSPGAAA